MASYGYTFSAGDTVTPTRLNSARTVSDIVNADIKSDAAIALSKLATGALPSAITVASANLTYDNGPTGGFRNRIINGNFDIWQRGTSHATNGLGSADRWRNSFNGSSCTMSRQAFALGQTDVPNEPTYFCRMTVTSSAGANNFSLLTQLIEGVRTLAGQQVTVSFYAKADAVRQISTELSQNFGTGGSPSSSIESIGVTKTTLSTSWQKITVTASVPSISGKTIGTNNDDRFALRIWLDAGSTYNANTNNLGQQSGTFDIAQVQVEQGSVATPFEARPIGAELALCQRYYWRGGYGWRGYAYSTTAGDLSGTFPVRMRANPTINGIAGLGSNAILRSGASTETINSSPNANANVNGGWYAFAGSGYTTGAHYILVTDLIEASAEL